MGTILNINLINREVKGAMLRQARLEQLAANFFKFVIRIPSQSSSGVAVHFYFQCYILFCGYYALENYF